MDQVGSRKIQSLERALDVLDALKTGPLRVTDLAKVTGSSKASVHHILATLESRRIVGREPHSFRYRLSWGAYELGVNVMNDAGFGAVMPPLLADLAELVGETTLFAIEDSGDVLVLERGQCSSSVLVANNVPGHRIPMHATASGKVLLSFDPLLFGRLPSELKAFTPKTIISKETLTRQLSIIRKRGYATCWEENEVSLNSVATPVFNYDGSPAGAITITAPSGRMNQRTFRRYLEPLMEVAHQVNGFTGRSSDSAASSS